MSNTRSWELRQQRPTKRRGSATVELAVLLPFLVLLALGATDLGRFSYTRIAVATAARNGAVHGSKSYAAANDSTGIATAVRAELTGIHGYSTTNPTITTTRIGDDDDEDQAVQVRVSFQFDSLIKYAGLPVSFNVVRTVRMRVQPT